MATVLDRLKELGGQAGDTFGSAVIGTGEAIGSAYQKVKPTPKFVVEKTKSLVSKGVFANPEEGSLFVPPYSEKNPLPTKFEDPFLATGYYAFRTIYPLVYLTQQTGKLATAAANLIKSLPVRFNQAVDNYISTHQTEINQNFPEHDLPEFIRPTKINIKGYNEIDENTKVDANGNPITVKNF